MVPGISLRILGFQCGCLDSSVDSRDPDSGIQG